MQSSDESSIWGTITRISVILGIIASLIAIAVFIKGISGPPRSSASDQGSTATATTASDSQTPGTITATSTSEAQPTATPTPKPVTPGTVFCRAGGAAGWGGWPVSGSWHVLSGNLVNDGSDSGSDMGPNLVAPDNCQPTVADYAVTVSLKVDQISSSGASYGVDARTTAGSDGTSGYVAWLYPYTDASGAHADFYLSPIGSGEDLAVKYNHGFDQNWHTLKVAVSGNHLSVQLDGATILVATDNQFLSPGQIGLVCHYDQIEVRSFQAVAL